MSCSAHEREAFREGRGLPPPEVLAARPHGTRLRYMGGCRCVPCRAANSRYECARLVARKRGEWNGILDAAPARAHVLALGRRGVGYKSVAAAASCATSIVAKIRSGERTRVRSLTSRRILAVDKAAVADGARVCARATWRLVEQLLAEGYTRGELAVRLGAKRRALQLGRRHVLASTAVRVERLFRRLTE